MASRFFDIPSKWKAFCKSCTVIFTDLGHDQCHLKTEYKCLDGATEAESKLRRMTFGERNINKTNKTILLVGETGTGKSNLINAMVNYVAGVEFDHNIRFTIVDDGKETSSQSTSQTTAVTMYEIFSGDDSSFKFNLSVIDTPGYGDTRGTKQDAAVTDLLHGLFKSEEGIHEISAVGFVMKASENRLSDRQMYIFDAVLSLFGKDIEKNIVALITHSDGGKPTNALKALEDAKIPCAKNKKGHIVHFLFNNRKTEAKTGDAKEDGREEKVLKLAWETTQEGMDDLFEFLNEVEPQDLRMTVEVLDKRIQVEAVAKDYQQQIKYIELKQVERRQHEKALQNQKGAFKVTVDEPYIDTESTIFNVLSCPVCKKNCHDPAWIWTYMFNMLRYRNFTYSGKCIVCRCCCSEHVKEKKRYVNTTRKVTKTFEDLLKEYQIPEKDLSDVQKKEKLITAVKESIDKAELKKNQLVEDSYQNVLKLQDIALRGTPLSIYQQLDFLIEKIKETGKPDRDQKVDTLRSIKSGVEKENSGGLSYLQAK